tara:strand:- start:25 stop:630 length:606 start_codon:yes stop_codon:yes gene_type:complete
MGYYSDNELEEQLKLELKLANPNIGGEDIDMNDLVKHDKNTDFYSDKTCYKCSNGYPVGMNMVQISQVNKYGIGGCPPGWFNWATFSQMDCGNNGILPDYGPCGTAPTLQSSVQWQGGGESEHGIKVKSFFANMKAKYNQGKEEIREGGENGIKEGSCGYTETPEGQKLPTPGGTKGMSADDRTKSMMKKLIQKEIKKFKK